MRAIDADALQLAIVEEGQANKRKKYIIGDIWELTGAEIREVINSQPTIQPEIIRCRECKFASGDSRICMKFDHSPIGELDFCSFAERREVNNESD